LPPFTLLHSADWQIGKPYARVSDPDKRALLRQVRLQAIGRIATHAAATAAELVVVAGDLFDSPTPGAADVIAVCAAIGAIPCAVLVIPGNHDHGGPGSLWEQPFFLGQQQQLAIGRALLTRPKLLILDEPTEGIQPNIIDQIGDAIKMLRDEGEMAILLVEQYLDFCKELGDDFAILERGRVAAAGPMTGLSEELIKEFLTV
jgi:ABC-type uncharacterized transport system fused permease/ATPase subunit